LRGTEKWAVALLLLALATPVAAQRGFPPTTVIVGGQPMVSDRELPENLAASADHRVLLGLLASSGLLEQLRGRGPFTLFAPTDAAFAALPPGELERLRLPENKAGLRALLGLHIVPGNFSSKRMLLLLRGVKSAELDTLSGAELTLGTNGPSNLVLRDPMGDLADIVVYDAKQANGVLFVIDRVLQPAA